MQCNCWVHINTNINLRLLLIIVTGESILEEILYDNKIVNSSIEVNKNGID
ncbi:hypothetical protein ACV3K6_12625 [Clostridium perfringens]